MAKSVLFWRAALVAALWCGGVAAGTAPSVPEGKPDVREVRRADSALSHCVVDQAYGNGRHLNIARNVDGQLNIGIVVPGAAYDPSATYPVRLELGAAPMRISKARAQSAEMLLIDLGKDAEFAAQLPQAQMLAVVGRSDRMEFPLPHAAAMLEQLEQCAGQRASVLPEALRELLRAAGLGDSVAYDPGATPDGRTFADYGWRRGAVTGGSRQRDLSRAVDFAGIVKAHLAALKDHCRGTWQETVGALTGFGAARQQRALLTCTQEREGAALGVLFHQAADGRFSIISHAGAREETENVRAATAALAKVLAAGAEAE